MPFINQLFQLQSRFAPIPITVHIAFCILATLLFTVLYIRQRKIADFLWLIVCDIPLILHWYGDAQTAYTVLGCEIVLLFLIFIEWLKERKAKKEKAENAETTETAEADEPAEAVEEKTEEAQETEASVKAPETEVLEEQTDASEAEKAEKAAEDKIEHLDMSWKEVYGEGKSVDSVDLERLDKEFGKKCKENAKTAKKNLEQTAKIEVTLEAENSFSIELPKEEEK